MNDQNPKPTDDATDDAPGGQQGPRCPKCGNIDIAFDWDAVVTIHVVDGAPTAVILGGLLDVLPDRANCENCGDITFDYTNIAESDHVADIIDTVRADLPAEVNSRLSDETSLYTF